MFVFPGKWPKLVNHLRPISITGAASADTFKCIVRNKQNPAYANSHTVGSSSGKNYLDLLYVCNAGAELSKLKLTPLFVLYTIYMIHRTDI